MSTAVQYGNVFLYNLFTQQIDQEAVFDDTGTDLMYWRFTVRVAGFIRKYETSPCMQFTASFPQNDQGVPVPPVDAADAHKAIRPQLAPRQSFRLLMNNLPVLTADPMPPPRNNPPPGDEPTLTNYDVNQGPKCLSFRPTQIAGRNVWRVEAVFEICKLECKPDGTTENASGVLSHRWSVQDSLDKNLRVTRTFSGLLRTAGGAINPHDFRAIVLPPLQPFLRRDQMQFTAGADGKSLAYTITDQEVAVAPPIPLRHWEIQHSEQLSGGEKVAGEIQVMMEADSQADKRQMVEIGIWLIYTQLGRMTPNAQGGFFANNAHLEHAVITDYIGDVNRVSIAARVWRNNPSPDKFKAFMVNLALVEILPEHLPRFSGNPTDESHDPPAGGDFIYDPKNNPGRRHTESPLYEGPVALAGAFVALLRSPCTDAWGNRREAVLPDNNDETTNEPTAPTVAVVPELPDPPTSDIPSAAHKTAMYVYYRMQSLFKSREMIAAMPIARSTSGSGSSSSTSGGSSSSSQGQGLPRDTEFCRLAPPQYRRKVRIIAERIGEWPEMPDPKNLPGFYSQSAQINQVLLNTTRSFSTPELNAMGQMIYRVRFDCTYGLDRAPEPNLGLPVGRNIWTNQGDYQTSHLATNGWQQQSSSSSGA